MTLPESVRDAVEPDAGRVLSAEPVAGGCIANASRLDAERGRFFLKWAEGEAGASFSAEAAGLAALRAADSPLRIPEVVACRDADREPGVLLLEWIEPGRPDLGFARRLGEGLAALHAGERADGRFGFERATVIGRLPQSNRWHSSWPDFFRAERLEPQIAMARARGVWRPDWDRLAERVFDRLGAWLPGRPVSVPCHGDLWNGNAMADAEGRPVLFDPAFYYGHAATDLAMMRLFGGFDAETFAAYHAIHPKSTREAEAVYQLYHLLAHLNLFGTGYAGQVEATLRRLG